MGYNVEYTFSLWLDATEPYQFLSYDRGRCRWDGDEPPPDHEGEGLRDDLAAEYAGASVGIFVPPAAEKIGV